jgi:proteasome alpha subunit
MYPRSSAAYDRAITVFSPDGRLFQVEYAREAVKRGSTAVGILFKNGGLLATDKGVRTKLLRPESIEKIFKIDEHIGAATSGLVADARRITHYARVEAQKERIAYNYPISVEELTKQVCDLKQMYTQYGGTRPFGSALLIMGVDDSGPQLFETDPSGAFSGAYAAAIGAGKKGAEALFEKQYREDASLEDAVKLAYKALKSVEEKSSGPETVDVHYILTEEAKFKKLTDAQLQSMFKK